MSADLCALASNQAKITLIYSLPNDKNNTSITLNRTGPSKIPLDLDYCDNHDSDVIPHFNKYSNQTIPNSGDFRNDKHENDLDQKPIDSKSYNKESINLFPTRDDHCESFRPIPNPRSVYSNDSNRSSSRSPHKGKCIH